MNRPTTAPKPAILEGRILCQGCRKEWPSPAFHYVNSVFQCPFCGAMAGKMIGPARRAKDQGGS